MAIDRTGITSLESGAPEITYSGNEGPQDPRAMTDIDKIILQHWIQQGGSYGDVIPEEFKQQVIQIYGLDKMASVPEMAYGGSANPTYTQKRKQSLAYGGIAGLDGRKRYGIGSWFQENIKDPIAKLIPNEIKENPVLSTALLGGALNQWGIPGIPGDVGENWGQNWIGELLGNVPGVKGGTVDTVIGSGGSGQSIMDIFRPETISKNPVGGLDQLAKDVIRSSGGDYIKDLYGITGVIDYDPTVDPTLGEFGKSDIPRETGTLRNYLEKTFGDTAKKVLQEKTDINLNNQQEQQRRALQNINWQTPLAIGMSMGALDKATRKDQSLPTQTGIDIPAIRTAALAGEAPARDAGLYFTPKDETRLLSNQGGRIRYSGGGNGNGKDDSMVGISMSIEERWERIKKMLKELEDIKKGKGIDPDPEDKAQGGRIGAQEGGLMDLGGMEKDYRNEGGFVPIGGQERADDVPARLSKNEFVFTADAVRSAGGGDIDKGAEVMENVMEHLEQGGQISEESQGLEGARNMFATAQRLEGVL